MVAAVLKLFRSASTDQGTVGALVFGGQHCYSLELPDRGNARARSSIPVGTYPCTFERHRKLGNVYRLANVPGRSGVLLHSANFAGDIELGWQSHLEGCIAPCEKLGSMTNKFGRPQLAGMISRPAVDRIIAWAEQKNFTLEIS